MFSSCSREDIGRVLFTKASCFMSPQTQCGDYRVEPGEECDVGEFDTDPCCTSTCMLREGMTCRYGVWWEMAVFLSIIVITRTHAHTHTHTQ